MLPGIEQEKKPDIGQNKGKIMRFRDGFEICTEGTPLNRW